MRQKVTNWREQSAEPEISTRRDISKTGASTIEFLQSTLRRGTGKNILDKLRTELKQLENKFNQQNQYQGVLLSIKAAKSMVDQETGERGFLITGEEHFLEPYYQGKKDFKETIIKLRILTDTKIRGSAKTPILRNINAVHELGGLWVEKAALPEINARRQVDQNNVQTLQYIQRVLTRATGKNLLDELRVLFDEVNADFIKANHEKGRYRVLQLAKAMVDQETGQRGYLITGDKEFLEPYNSGLEDFRTTIPKLKSLVANYFDIKKVLEKIKKITALNQQWLNEAAKPEIQLRRDVLSGKISQQELENKLSKGHGKAILDEIRNELNSLYLVLEQSKRQQGTLLVTAIAKSVIEQETGQRAFLLTGNKNSLKKFLSGKINLKNNFTQLEELVKSSFDKNSLLNKIERIRLKAEEWRNKAAKPEIAIRKNINERGTNMNDITTLIENETGKNIVDKIRKILDEFIEIEQGLLSLREAEARLATDRTITAIIISTIFAIFARTTGCLHHFKCHYCKPQNAAYCDRKSFSRRIHRY